MLQTYLLLLIAQKKGEYIVTVLHHSSTFIVHFCGVYAMVVQVEPIIIVVTSCYTIAGTVRLIRMVGESVSLASYDREGTSIIVTCF